MKVLVTGAAGYIGAHVTVALLDAGHEVVMVDMVNRSDVVDAVRKITRKAVAMWKADSTDPTWLSHVFDCTKPDAVIHLAGFKSVAESVRDPLRYYRNNLDSLLTLCEVMKTHGVKKLVYSSSATVYGTFPDAMNHAFQEHEESPHTITNPYGMTKMMGETILRDLAASDPSWEISILRYFNPVGAHTSGLIGENPLDTPNNLAPYVARVAAGLLQVVKVFGGDYPTVDGTGVRDYIHVVDLAEGHLAALDHLVPGAEIYNLGTNVPADTCLNDITVGTGKGASVLEVIKAFRVASGHTIPYTVVDRRPGDVASCVANVDKANKVLGWTAKRSLHDMANDAWNYQYQLQLKSRAAD